MSGLGGGAGSRNEQVPTAWEAPRFRSGEEGLQRRFFDLLLQEDDCNAAAVKHQASGSYGELTRTNQQLSSSRQRSPRKASSNQDELGLRQS